MVNKNILGGGEAEKPYESIVNSDCTFTASYYPLKLPLKFASLLISEVALSASVKLPAQLLTSPLMAVICGRLKDTVNSKLPRFLQALVWLCLCALSRLPLTLLLSPSRLPLLPSSLLHSLFFFFQPPPLLSCSPMVLSFPKCPPPHQPHTHTHTHTHTTQKSTGMQQQAPAVIDSFIKTVILQDLKFPMDRAMSKPI